MTNDFLNQFVFHDLPVQNVNFDKTAKQLTIDFLVYNETTEDYDCQKMIFQKVEMLQFDEVVLIKNEDLEIYGFEYEFRAHQFYGKMILLLGFEGPDTTIEFVSSI